MALVPIIQPAAIKLVTTKKERAIKMNYKASGVSKRTKILFPIIISVVALDLFHQFHCHLLDS
ncbi:sodium ion-translocating decarboxylase subunit beta [Erysipelothrix sp. D19-032]